MGAEFFRLDGGMMQEVNVVVCPNCGDMWITQDDKINYQCECFRCNHKYIPQKIYKMDKWIYDLVKIVKGK